MSAFLKWFAYLCGCIGLIVNHYDAATACFVMAMFWQREVGPVTQPTIHVLGKDSPEGQRLFGEHYRASQRGGL